jgi:hypothetical protein
VQAGGKLAYIPEYGTLQFINDVRPRRANPTKNITASLYETELEEKRVKDKRTDKNAKLKNWKLLCRI